MSDYVLFEQKERIAYVTLNRLKRVNALVRMCARGSSWKDD